MSSAPEKDYTINRFSQCLPCSASVPLQLVFVFVGTDIATLKLLEPNFHNMSEPLYSSPYKFHSCQDNCVNEHLLTESCVTGPTKNSSTVTYYAWRKRRFRRVGVKPAGSSHTELELQNPSDHEQVYIQRAWHELVEVLCSIGRWKAAVCYGVQKYVHPCNPLQDVRFQLSQEDKLLAKKLRVPQS